MRLKSKRLISLLLAGSTMVSMLPASAVTAFAETAANTSVTSEAAQGKAVTVSSFTTGQLEAAVRSAAALQGVNDISQITKLTVSGGTMNKTDFEFVSGVHVEGDGSSASTVTYPTTDSAYLSGLTKLDLTSANCEDGAIPPRAFCFNKTIESIVLPCTLKTIGLGSISNMEKLTYVGIDKDGTTGSDIKFPDSLETIGFCAFYGDKVLSGKLILPERHINLGSAAFTFTKVSGTIKIGANTTLMAAANGGPHKETFRGTNISAVEFDNTVMEVPDNFLNVCPSLTEIKIADGVQKIGSNAFNNSTLKGNSPIVIPKSVTSIGDSAFANIHGVDRIIVENAEVNLGTYCFSSNHMNTGAKIYLAGLPNDGVQHWYSNVVILNMDGGTIDTTKLAESDKNNKTGLYTPVKEGYTFEGWYNGDSKLDDAPATNQTYTAHWKQNTDSAVLTTDMENKAYTVGDETEFSFTTIADGSNYVGTTVKAFATLSDAEDAIEKDGLQYWETTSSETDKWKPLLLENGSTSFGPTNGFPLTNGATSNFKVTFKKAGTYTFNVAMKQVDANGNETNETPVCEKKVTIRVSPRVQKITLPNDVAVTVNGEDVTDEIQGKYLNVSVKDLDEGATVAVSVKNPKYGDTYEWSGVESADVSKDGKTYTFKVVDSDPEVTLVTTSHPYAVGDFEVTGLGEYTYGDKVNVTVTPKDPSLTDADYDVKYYDADGNEVAEMKEVGTYTVKIRTADQELEAGKVVIKPADEPVKTAKLTFSNDCIVTADKEDVTSGDSVKVGATVTVNLAKAVDSSMKFDSYVIAPIPDDLKTEGTTATFTMPEKDVDVTVRLTSEESDDSLDAATVVTGVVLGTGTAILAYHIGTEVYAEQVLGKGVAIPRTREEVALKAWELAGKPDVELNGEPLSEAAQAEKWAVESGLMQNVDGSFNGSKKMSKLKALRTLDAAKKLG